MARLFDQLLSSKRARFTYWSALCVFACRSHVSLCEPTCETEASGGKNPVNAEGGAGAPVSAGGVRAMSGGAAGESGSGAVNAGGSGATVDSVQGGAGAGDLPPSGAGAGGFAECDDDDDCRDASLCNGEERCESGSCVPGDTISCEHGMTCDDNYPSEPCGYANPSPWLLLYSNQQLWGLPTARIGKEPPIALGEREVNVLWLGFDKLYFSPDGRHALLQRWTIDLGTELLELYWGRGIPNLLQNVANLPNWGKYSEPVFSADSLAAVIRDSNRPAYYWLDFSHGTAVPTRIELPDHAALDSLQFCRDSHTLLLGPYETALINLGADLAMQEPSETELGPGEKAVSPDQSMIFIAGDNARIARCSPVADATSLGAGSERGAWSTDGTHLVTVTSDDSVTLYSVSKELTAQALWSGPSVTDWRWSSDNNRLVVRRLEGGAAQYGYLDVSASPVVLQPLKLTGNAELGPCGADGCLAFVPNEPASSRQLVFQAFASDSEPSLLAPEQPLELGIDYVDFAQRSVLLHRGVAEDQTELVLIDYSEASPSERRLVTWKSTRYDYDPDLSPVQVASDGSGVVVNTEQNLQQRIQWFSLTAPDASPIVFDVPAYAVTFQPWP